MPVHKPTHATKTEVSRTSGSSSLETIVAIPSKAVEQDGSGTDSSGKCGHDIRRVGSLIRQNSLQSPRLERSSGTGVHKKRMGVNSHVKAVWPRTDPLICTFNGNNNLLRNKSSRCFDDS